ncbi:C6 zinc finger domain-containing protein [Zopfia rhizophila CBS 207.26]|uniref:C6 zinc finger domain-containing protein n=1 Tax=Zopfia rhizophila CBS 207.26 TaxID=1314779 RepID=A0A6A6EXR6_9PEZI|nr:C6 zinc finger domain-containing protein [Zopfia rhizophila CBS 207.26]
MTKRSLDAASSLSRLSPHGPPADRGNGGSDEEAQAVELKKPRTFMATLACDNCRVRKTRCDEDRPRCGYCKASNFQCNYPEPRLTKKDQSMTVAINAIRRLESKVEVLATAINKSSIPPQQVFNHHSPPTISPQTSGTLALGRSNVARHEGGSINDVGLSPQALGTPGKSPYPISESFGQISISFSQHGVALWPAVKQILPSQFNAARDNLPKDYVLDCESHRPSLCMALDTKLGGYSECWLTCLPLSVIKGLADAYFAIFNRITPVLDKFHFFSSTLGLAMENDFGYDIETCLVLNVLALGCLAVKAYEEGNFHLPSRSAPTGSEFESPEWYDLVVDDPPGLKFFNEARKRMGFLMCQNDLRSGQFYMLSTLYYAQILRPIDSWITVNRAALCSMSILKRSEFIDFDEWEGDMFSRLFWNTLMYETILIQELNLPLSGLQEYEVDVPIPKFTPYPRPKTSISGLIIDEDDSFFNFHFLAQAAHRIILTRIRHSLYFFSEKEGFPPPAITAEMHHQLEEWRINLPPALQFSDHDNADNSPSPAHVIAKAMLKSRYLVAKFHIGRPFLYKALHAPALTTEADYREVQDGLKSGMYWPTTMGLCTQMKSSLPLKFGWCCQCFGQVLLFHAVARSPDPKLRETLPAGWQDWVQVMTNLIDSCGKYSPAIGKDAEILRLL